MLGMSRVVLTQWLQTLLLLLRRCGLLVSVQHRLRREVCSLTTTRDTNLVAQTRWQQMPSPRRRR
jgi:hypothetical protein